jgi:putative endonuclease
MGYYYVYILKCNDGTFYTGVTNNLDKRVEAHNTKKTGAKYTKSRRPVILVYQKRHKDRSRAQQSEYKVRNLTRDEKILLIKDYMEKT